MDDFIAGAYQSSHSQPVDPFWNHPARNISIDTSDKQKDAVVVISSPLSIPLALESVAPPHPPQSCSITCVNATKNGQFAATATAKTAASSAFVVIRSVASFASPTFTGNERNSAHLER